MDEINIIELIFQTSSGHLMIVTVMLLVVGFVITIWQRRGDTKIDGKMLDLMSLQQNDNSKLREMISRQMELYAKHMDAYNRNLSSHAAVMQQMADAQELHTRLMDDTNRAANQAQTVSELTHRQVENMQLAISDLSKIGQATAQAVNQMSHAEGQRSQKINDKLDTMMSTLETASKNILSVVDQAKDITRLVAAAPSAELQIRKQDKGKAPEVKHETS